MSKETKIQVIIICILSIVLGVLIFLIPKAAMDKNDRKFGEPMEENVVKETKKEDVKMGKNVEVSDIELSDYTENINISKGGEYNITGKFAHSLIINSTEKVILNLNNVEISSSVTAAIANINSGDLVINLVEGTTNILKDSGSSEYDGCIYSNGKLVFEGTGELQVYGKQQEGEGIATDTNDIVINGGNIYIEASDDGLNAGGDGGTITINGGNITIMAGGDGIDSNKNLVINGGIIYTVGSPKGGDAGIDTDDGFVINGGEVIALGSDMLETPKSNSIQKYVTFSLKTQIASSAKVELKDENLNKVISFEAKESFKTLIISNSQINSGVYSLYINGEKTEYTSIVK